MNSDMMEEVLGNPEKMEQARQAIIANPTLKQAMSQLPGFLDMVRMRRCYPGVAVMAVDRTMAVKSELLGAGGGAVSVPLLLTHLVKHHDYFYA